MFSENSKMRNCFLQKHLPNYRAEVINDLISKEFQKISDLHKPIEGLKSIQPIKSKVLGDDIGTLAYGSWGLTKIINEMSGDDSKIQMCAVKKLSELLLVDSERQRAISDFNIVIRLNNLLLRRRKQKHKDKHLIPLILNCLEILAKTLKAALQMSARPYLIHELYTLAERLQHREISSTILRILTEHPQVLDYFIHETNWFNELSETLIEHSMAMDKNLLEHFSHFLKLCPEEAIDRGFFELICSQITQIQSNQQILIKCFAFLLNCEEGQEKLDKCNGIEVLYSILTDEGLETYEFIVLAIQNATSASKQSIWACKELPELPYELIRLAHDKQNERLQLYCLQTLRQITTMPSVKQFVRKVCIPQIRNIECRTRNVSDAKENLLVWLKSDVYNQNRILSI